MLRIRKEMVFGHVLCVEDLVSTIRMYRKYIAGYVGREIQFSP